MSAHQYGPHRPQDHPTTVEVVYHLPGGGKQVREGRLCDEILKQREQLNGLAHRAALEAEQ